VTERVWPLPDAYASCPGDGPLLSYYAGVFDSVFVSLSPFIKPVSIPTALFTPATYPDRAQICAGCESVGWEEVRQKAGLPSISALDIALRTRISGLRPQFANQEFAALLEQAERDLGVISPLEGEHSDLLHNTVLGIFQALGHKWVWVGDEFSTERKLHWIDDLRKSQSSVIKGHCNVFAPDKSILWTVHWDSHFSFLCSREGKLQFADVESKLEGFFCEANSEVYWSTQ
jgi:hypothetical protein